MNVHERALFRLSAAKHFIGYSVYKQFVFKFKSLFVSSFDFLDIQEFYEVTLLNTQKSCEQKLEEVNNMAEQWEHSTTNSSTTHPQPACAQPEVRERRYLGTYTHSLMHTAWPVNTDCIYIGKE